jgi:hypothetical protein
MEWRGSYAAQLSRSGPFQFSDPVSSKRGHLSRGINVQNYICSHRGREPDQIRPSMVNDHQIGLNIGLERGPISLRNHGAGGTCTHQTSICVCIVQPLARVPLFTPQMWPRFEQARSSFLSGSDEVLVCVISI